MMTGRVGRRLSHGVLSAWIALLTACATTPAPTDQQPAAAATGAAAQPAPAFSATDLGGRSFRLADYRGKNLVLVFYIGHQ